MESSTFFNYETLVHATAGAVGNIIAATCVYPLDNIKLRKQLGDATLADKTTFQAICYILKTEGVDALYRGMKPSIESIGVSNFIYFYTFHGLKSLQLRKFNFQSTAKTDLLLSMCAGVANVLTSSPLWVVNSRLKVSKEEHYSGLIDGMIHIASTEGFQALWSGLIPSLVLIANPAIHFTVYEALKRRMTSNSAFTYFVLGALSKTVATVATYPLQLAQARQRHMKQQKINTAALLLSILKRNGPGGLYSGLESKLLQTVLASALAFMTYEKIAHYVFIILMK